MALEAEIVLRSIVFTLIACLLFLFLATLVFLKTAPTVYNPYRRELVVELDDTASVATRDADFDDAYAHFNKHRETNKTLRKDVSVQVVVLGDLGRSPRMQYHALSLARRGAAVQLIGFQESQLLRDLRDHPCVKVVPLNQAPALLQNTSHLPFIVKGPIKAAWQAVDLYHALAYRTDSSRWMLVQNPPAIPVLAVAQLVSFLRGTKLVIDWHNFGWSVLAVRLGSSHPLVRIARLYESWVSAPADAHFCVTSAMAKTIEPDLKAKPVVLHDRPADLFQPLTTQERIEFLSKLPETAQYAADILGKRWRLLVSSTSWTADEDFSLLLDALVQYSAEPASHGLPKMLVIITGKGPEKEKYLKQVSMLNQQKKLSKVVITTAWLSLEDYARLLGSADLGVCLHKSTSGLDLPMKVLDMFGAGLPVVGWNGYETWDELVKTGVNGSGFETAADLKELMVDLLGGDASALQQLRSGALEEGKRRWDSEWESVAGQLFVPPLKVTL